MTYSYADVYRLAALPPLQEHGRPAGDHVPETAPYTVDMTVEDVSWADGGMRTPMRWKANKQVCLFAWTLNARIFDCGGRGGQHNECKEAGQRANL